MKKYIKVKALIEKKVLSSITCDVCNKNIEMKPAYHGNGIISDYFYTISNSHHDWGNDSVDSFIVRSACGDDCLRKIIEEYLLEKSDSKQIEIKKVYEYIEFHKVVEYMDDKEYSGVTE